MSAGGDFILTKCMDFSVRIVKLRQYLKNERQEYDISKQLLRSGTSVGSNMTEAQSAISDKDFISKTTIALKECRESMYWIELLYRTDYLTEEGYQSLNTNCTELFKLITTILKSKKANLSQPDTNAPDKQL